MTQVNSKSIGQTSDLVVLAPWKDSIIEADEAILPATRFAVTFRAMFQIRRAAREANDIAAFSDPIERIEQVHSFRMAAHPQGMLLSVTYDFGWEPYMRALWRDAGPFLDLLLCNCRDYPLARTTDLDQWSAWVRRYEIASDYFYVAYPLTVADLQGLALAERLQRDTADTRESDLRLAGFASRHPAAAAAAIRALEPALANQQALAILAAMHRLTRFYGADVTAGTPLGDDALTLLRVTRALLEDWSPAGLDPAIAGNFARELDWYGQQRRRAPPATPPPAPAPDRANVQRGILSGFDGAGAPISHGAALFLMVSDASAARRSLATLALAAEDGSVADDGVLRTIAFTWPGLARLGMPRDWLEALPVALREGAAARAGQVGDIRRYHPRHWTRLPRNWRPGTGFQPDAGGEIETAIVDAVVQLRVAAAGAPADLADPGHPLAGIIEAFASRFPGWVLLSVEALNVVDPAFPGRDHFGFQDGISQPVVGAAAGQHWNDGVAPGDVLFGYPRAGNAADGAPAPAATPPHHDYPLIDSTCLAIRRMPMHRARFDAAVAKAAAATGIDSETIAAKIVGRRRDGTPLVPHAATNDFSYAADPEGALCPRQSHVRRANPRETAPPRIVRRGMTFGPPAAGNFAGDPAAERGNLFMAYCADLAEQYEVVLRWTNGANSTRIGSFLGDPLVGAADTGGARTYRFPHAGAAHRIALPAAADAYIGLSWSLYLLVPSIDLVRRIAAGAAEPPVRPPIPPELLDKARRLLRSLSLRNALEIEWRNWLDEPGARDTGMQAAIWQVIRDEHGGVLHAHDGSKPTQPSPLASDGKVIPVADPPRQDLVLIGRRDAILGVLRDDGRCFSVGGAGRRIRPSIEKFHLGLDAFTPDYQREAGACNAAIAAVSEAEAFAIARSAVADVLTTLLDERPPPRRVDLVKHLMEPAVAAMAPAWFGLPDGHFIVAGASDWRDIGQRTPMFPGDFWNSSRFAFNPFESAETARLSAIHGQAILAAAEAYIRHTRRDAIGGSIARALAAAGSGAPGETGLAYPGDRDLARGLVGAMLGWVATTLGNGARLFDAWTGNGTLLRTQLAWRAAAQHDHATATAIFATAMHATIGLAPVPECKWRVAAHDTAIGSQAVRGDSKLVLGLVSAAAEFPDDTHIWFGQSTPVGAPTPHGCPGRDMALGVLLGLVAGVAETVLLRPTGARLEVEINPLP